MDLDQAVLILNKKNHRNSDQWFFDGLWVQGGDQYDTFDAFEAIAIAEALNRNVEGAGQG
jgi:hypothetical protein